MAIDPVSSAGNVVNNTSLGKLSGDFDTFLKLLTTQLQNQDPTSPMDTNQMTDQLTQFSQVEQQITSNNKLDNILSALSYTASNQNLNYLGRVVEFESSKMSLMTIGKTEAGETVKEAVMAYNLPNVAADVEVQIIDPKTKQVIRTIEGDGQIGRHTVAWDGKNDSGAQVENGVYEFKVIAKDAAGADIPKITTSFIGLAYSLENTTTGPMLDVGMGLKVDPGTIKQVHAI